MSVLSDLMKEHTRECIINLARKYKFNKDEALKYLELEKEVIKEVSKNKNQILLPFCGVINDECCNGVKLNYGLYTQCTNSKDKKGFCKTCSKQAEKNSNGEPTYGTIQDRLAAGDEFRDPKGKPAVRYANIMEKLNISKDDALAQAKKLGLIIPEEEFELLVKKRGRPKKSVAVSDTESEHSIVEPKKRGRPRKDKSLVTELATGDDLIAGLIKEAKKESPPEPTPPKTSPPKAKSPEPVNTKESSSESSQKVDSDDEEEEEEVQVEVTRFTDPKSGTEYYKTDDNILYNMDSEPVGRWNPKTKSIETLDLDLDSDED